MQVRIFRNKITAIELHYVAFFHVVRLGET